jgi:hypothetical protein
VGKPQLNCISIGKSLHGNELIVAGDGVNSKFLRLKPFGMTNLFSANPLTGESACE